MTTCVPSFLNYIFTYVFWGIFRVLHEHIQRLSKVVTANHRALQIPEVISLYSMGGGIQLKAAWCAVYMLPVFQGSRIY